MEQAVIRVQELFWTALKTRDRHLFERVLANNFVAVSPDGANQSRPEFIHLLTSFQVQVLSVRADSLQVHILGDVAVLTGVQIARLRLPDGKELADTLAITNVYRRTGDTWQLVLAHPVEYTPPGDMAH